MVADTFREKLEQRVRARLENEDEAAHAFAWDSARVYVERGEGRTPFGIARSAAYLAITLFQNRADILASASWPDHVSLEHFADMFDMFDAAHPPAPTQSANDQHKPQTNTYGL